MLRIKTPHERLNIAHTVAGMSGSPIFLDGKIMGPTPTGGSLAPSPSPG